MAATAPTSSVQAMDVRLRIGTNLRDIRRERGLSQEELAHRAAVHQTYLSGLERGRRNPSVLVLAKIAGALDIDVEELVKRARSTRA